jgi:hypothetical protein
MFCGNTYILSNMGLVLICTLTNFKFCLDSINIQHYKHTKYIAIDINQIWRWEKKPNFRLGNTTITKHCVKLKPNIAFSNTTTKPSIKLWYKSEKSLKK